MFKKMSLKIKLIALFLLVGLMPVIVIGLLSYNSAEREIREEVFKQLEIYASQCVNSMDAYFDGIFNDANIMATTRDIYNSMVVLSEAGYDTSSPDWLERTGIINTLMATLAEDKGYDLICLTDRKGTVIYSTMQDMVGDDLSDRNYFQDAMQGRTEWSQLFFSNFVNTNVMTVGAPIRSGGRSGNVLGTLNISVTDQEIANFLHSGLGELGATADAFLINEDGLLFSNTRLGENTHDAALKKSINSRAVELLAPAIRAGNMDFYDIAEFIDFQGNPILASVGVVKMGRLPMGLEVNIDQAEAFAGVTALRNKLIPIVIATALVIAFVAFMVAMTIVRPVQKVSDLTVHLAEGDFTAGAEIASRDEVGQMAQNINNTVLALRKTLQRVQAAADNVSHAADEISAGNQDLSQRTEEQASSLEEIASTIEEIASSLEASSAHSAEADNLSRRTLESVQQGEEVVKDMQGAMGEITQGNQEIAEIIAKVNDIAFQTNLLALNAAVEAARAGEQGRGFAVVAAEVRNLAGHSAESAKEIEKLIKDSIVRVDKGNSLMDETEKVLQEIIGNTQKTSDVVGEIASSLKEQSTAAGDIRAAVEELNQVTQQNASLVEEIASSSENMHSEAVELANQISFFKLSANGKTNGVPVFKECVENNKKGVDKKAVPPKAAAFAAGFEGPEYKFDEDDFEKF